MSATDLVPASIFDACMKMVDTLSAVRQAPSTEAAASAQPNWDAMANSFASLSVALTVGSIFLAVVSILSAGGWGYIVKRKAEEEAREEAEKIARRIVDDWLSTVAPGLIRSHMELLNRGSAFQTEGDAAMDEIGREAD